MSDGWIGVDLDGTLAHYDGWKGPDHIGPPIPKMLDRIKHWISEGKTVKIFTARCCVSSQISPVIEWLKKHGLGGLEVTNIKDYGMIELWDDRSVQVVRNTGLPVQEIKHFSNELPEYNDSIAFVCPELKEWEIGWRDIYDIRIEGGPSYRINNIEAEGLTYWFKLPRIPK